MEFLWRKPTADGNDFTLERNRPACREVPGGGARTTFSCQTDYLAEHVGTQDFRAFVHARLFGVPLPVPLEVTEDSRTALTVRTGAFCPGVPDDLVPEKGTEGARAYVQMDPDGRWGAEVLGNPVVPEPTTESVTVADTVWTTVAYGAWERMEGSISAAVDSRFT